MTEIKHDTTIEQISLDDINSLLDINGSIAMLPNEEKKKPNVFSQIDTDLTFLDKPVTTGTEENAEEIAAKAAIAETARLAKEAVDALKDPAILAAEKAADKATADAAALALLKQPKADAFVDDDDEKNKGGRPTAFIAATKSLIDKKILLPFDDGKKIEDYSAADIEELIEANFQRTQTELQEKLPAQFFQGMPLEMQQAYRYIAEGGQDLKSLFQAMGTSQEIRELNIESEAGQAYAVRTYLQATNYGTPDEIEEEIQSLQDRGDLEKKATQFKPKLDAMQQNMIQQKIAAQEQKNLQRQEQSQNYMESVYNVLAKATVNGTPIDSRTQNLLYAGLVQPNYPSISGKQTNLLGHLLEKYQWVEPNHELISEVMWLLADPEGYRGEIRKVSKTAAVVETVRKLKDAQSNLSNSTAADVDDSAGSPPDRRSAIPRPKKNFFAR